MKKTLLDTDILSYFLSEQENVVKNAETYLEHHESLTISSITYYEIIKGLKYKAATIQLRKFKAFSATCEILSINFPSLEVSSEIYADLRTKGITIGDHDLLIAGIAVSNDLVLTTNNEKYFQSVSKLKVVNWTVR
jgi:predicted nucleic acid-binding protein